MAASRTSSVWAMFFGAPKSQDVKTLDFYGIPEKFNGITICKIQNNEPRIVNVIEYNKWVQSEGHKKGFQLADAKNIPLNSISTASGAETAAAKKPL